jgi:hypothetical protein
MRYDNDFDFNDIGNIHHAVNTLLFYGYKVLSLEISLCRLYRYTIVILFLKIQDNYEDHYIIYGTNDIPIWQLIQFDSSNRG